MTELEVAPLTYTAPPEGVWWKTVLVWRGAAQQRNTQVAELAGPYNRKLHFDLYGPATAQFDISGRSPDVAQIQELAQDVVVLRWVPASASWQTLFRGVIGHMEDTLDGTSHTVNISATDYRAMLDRRIVGPATFTATLQETIVSTILANWTQGSYEPLYLGLYYNGVRNPDGSALSGNTGINRTITYAGTEQAATEFDKLGQTVNGFDWGVEPAFNWGLPPNPADPIGYVDLYFPQRGVVQPFVAEYGINVTNVKRVTDSATFANWVLMTGASGTAPQSAAGDVMAHPQNHPEGLWSEAKSDANVADTTILSIEAQWELLTDSQLLPTYQLVLAPGAWNWKTDFWLGDTITIRVTSGRLAVNTQARVMQIDMAINDMGTEQVTVTVGRKTETLRDVIRGQNLNLYQLNRR